MIEVRSSTRTAISVSVDETFARHLSFLQDHNLLTAAQTDDLTGQIHFYEVNRVWIDSLAVGWQEIAIVAEHLIGTRDHSDPTLGLAALVEFATKRWPHRMVYVPAPNTQPRSV